MHWIIERSAFPASADRIIGALERCGIRWTEYRDEDAAARGPCDGRALFWGSLGAAYEQRVAAAFRPGAIGDPDEFLFSRVHRQLGSLLANRDLVFTSASRLVADPGRELAALGSPPRVFVRPDSALKPFSGRVVDLDQLDLAALDHGTYHDDAELAVVVSSAKPIGREWRFVIAGGEVVAGCEYEASRRGLPGAVPEPPRALAREVASCRWQPAPLYVADVAEVAGALALVELNPFSGADLYDCEPDAVVLAASAVADRMAG